MRVFGAIVFAQPTWPMTIFQVERVQCRAVGCQTIGDEARQTLAQIILGEANITSAKIEGERAPLGELIELLDVFEFWFGIAEP